MADKMTSHASTQRPELERNATWPSVKMDPPQSSTAHTDTQAFRDDVDQHPERHFLSPITAEEVYGWDSDDSDEDDDEGEWNAGITDFALFSADRKRAMETGEALDRKWNTFVSHQNEAFQRSVERSRENEVPALTPDASPDLRDLDVIDEEDEESEEAKLVVPWIQVPDYLTVEVKPSQKTFMIGPDEDLPLSLRMPRKKRVERPGLSHARTLSGKRHVWRRPGWDMFTVGEEAEAEEKAEREDDELRRVASTGALELRTK